MTAVTARANGGMVTAPHAVAAQCGARILAEGGNAIEAVLATAATLSVVYPHMTGLGGDSFWLIAEPGKDPLTIDGAGAAGSAVSAELYHRHGLAAVPWRGALAANTVAGALSAWSAASQLSATWGGRLPLSRIFAEAVALAEQGIAVTAGHADAALRFQAELDAVPGFRALHFSGATPPRVERAAAATGAGTYVRHAGARRPAQFLRRRSRRADRRGTRRRGRTAGRG